MDKFFNWGSYRVKVQEETFRFVGSIVSANMHFLGKERFVCPGTGCKACEFFNKEKIFSSAQMVCKPVLRCYVNTIVKEREKEGYLILCFGDKVLKKISKVKNVHKPDYFLWLYNPIGKSPEALVFIKDIVKDDMCLTSKLIFADWLEDDNDFLTAEAVRLHVEFQKGHETVINRLVELRGNISIFCPWNGIDFKITRRVCSFGQSYLAEVASPPKPVATIDEIISWQLNDLTPYTKPSTPEAIAEAVEKLNLLNVYIGG